MTRSIGTTRPVWHVVGPGVHDWWTFDTERQARAKAGERKDRRVVPGVSTFSVTPSGLFRFWAVDRPEWES